MTTLDDMGIKLPISMLYIHERDIANFKQEHKGHISIDGMIGVLLTEIKILKKQRDLHAMRIEVESDNYINLAIRYKELKNEYDKCIKSSQLPSNY
jgi:hypothetical protein